MPSTISAGTTAGTAIAIAGDTTGNLAFQTNGTTTAMTINTSQQVGIGTTSPSNPLHVVNSSANVNLLNLVGTNTYTGTALAGEGPFKFQNTNTTNGNMSSFSNYDGNGNLNSQVNFINVNHSGVGEIAFTTRNGGSYPEKMRITAAGYVKASNDGTYVSTSGTYHEFRNSVSDPSIFVTCTNASFGSNAQIIDVTRAATSAYNFGLFRSSAGGDNEFVFRGDGNGFADGTWNNNGADYAEFFESATGQAIPVGSTVVLENNKVRVATESDNPANVIGVVRPKEPSKASMVVGNTAWNKWANKYLTDDFDRYIMEDHDVVEWTDAEGKQHSYESHNIPEGITVPANATIKTHDDKGNKFQHYKLNPAWDPSAEYVNRENRDEWLIIGLIGQVKVLKGQTMGDRWKKMRDVSASVEEWFIR